MTDYERKLEAYRKQIAAGSGWRPEQEEQLAKLQLKKDQAQDQLEATEKSLSTVQYQVTDLLTEINNLSKERDDLKSVFGDLEGEISEIGNMCTKEINKKKVLDNTLKSTKEKMRESTETISEKQNQIDVLTSELAGFEKQLNLEKANLLESENDIKLAEEELFRTQKRVKANL